MSLSPDDLKHMAAIDAVRMVEDGMVVGLGTGSTVRHALLEISRRIKEEELSIVGIPTSRSTEDLAGELGIPISNLVENPRIDIDIDGADEVDPRLDVIKGGGGAHVREKVIAVSSDLLVIIADGSKLSDRIGTKSPVPVEILPMARPLVSGSLEDLGGTPELRAGTDEKPFLTDNGNNIIDCRFGPIDNPAQLEGEIKSITGVVDSGIFPGLAGLAIIATDAGTRKIRRD
jgi:ribose 5-phosphate isomerase A